MYYKVFYFFFEDKVAIFTGVFENRGFIYIEELVKSTEQCSVITCRRRECPRRRNQCRVRKSISLRQNSLKPTTALLLYGDDASTTFCFVSKQNHIRIFFYLSIPRKPRKKESHQRATKTPNLLFFFSDPEKDY